MFIPFVFLIVFMILFCTQKSRTKHPRIKKKLEKKPELARRQDALLRRLNINPHLLNGLQVFKKYMDEPLALKEQMDIIEELFKNDYNTPNPNP